MGRLFCVQNFSDEIWYKMGMMWRMEHCFTNFGGGGGLKLQLRLIRMKTLNIQLYYSSNIIPFPPFSFTPTKHNTSVVKLNGLRTHKNTVPMSGGFRHEVPSCKCHEGGCLRVLPHDRVKWVRKHTTIKQHNNYIVTSTQLYSLYSACLDGFTVFPKIDQLYVQSLSQL